MEEKSWYSHGVRHRTDGPALDMMTASNCKCQAWYVDGKLHRLDGPAVVKTSHVKGREYHDYQWWVDGRRHRLDGPAVTKFDGTREWWVDGKRHRLDGPAIESPGAPAGWWINGKPRGMDVPVIQLRLVFKQHRDDTSVFLQDDDHYGYDIDVPYYTSVIFYKQENISYLHYNTLVECHVYGDTTLIVREVTDAPRTGVMREEDGVFLRPTDLGYQDVVYGAWFEDGKCHRADGPAINTSDGEQQWRLKGRLHRLDGPAYVPPSDEL
jgi:hypothetical protein